MHSRLRRRRYEVHWGLLHGMRVSQVAEIDIRTQHVSIVEEAYVG